MIDCNILGHLNMIYTFLPKMIEQGWEFSAVLVITKMVLSLMKKIKILNNTFILLPNNAYGGGVVVRKPFTNPRSIHDSRKTKKIWDFEIWIKAACRWVFNQVLYNSPPFSPRQNNLKVKKWEKCPFLSNLRICGLIGIAFLVTWMTWIHPSISKGFIMGPQVLRPTVKKLTPGTERDKSLLTCCSTKIRRSNIF